MGGEQFGWPGVVAGLRPATVRRAGVPVSLRKRVAVRQTRELRKRKSLVRR